MVDSSIELERYKFHWTLITGSLLLFARSHLARFAASPGQFPLSFLTELNSFSFPVARAWLFIKGAKARPGDARIVEMLNSIRIANAADGESVSQPRKEVGKFQR